MLLHINSIDHQNESSTSSSVHNLKQAVKCSLANVLDINVASSRFHSYMYKNKKKMARKFNSYT